MEMSPSSASPLATQEFHNILWTPKVHNPIHKSPPLIPVLNPSAVYVSEITHYIHLSLCGVFHIHNSTKFQIEILKSSGFLFIRTHDIIVIPLTFLQFEFESGVRPKPRAC
jgi:hypothetical protein